MEREIINKEPYQLEGIEYLYFYDRANALVICTMPYGYEERKADEDWDREYGGSLFDTITVEGKKYVELESVGLANENWQNQAERDEYLRRWANDIKRQVKAEVLVNTPNDHEPSEKENVLEDESDDLRQLVNELKNNGMEQTAEQVSQLMNQVDNMTNMVQGLMNEISRLNESIQDMQDSRLPNRIKKSLNEDVERIEKRYEETKEQVSEIRDDIKIKAGNIMDDYKMRGKAALNRMLEFIELKSKLTNVRDNMLHGIEDIDRTLGKIDVLGKGMRDAGNLVANTIRNVTDKETIDYSSREKKFSKTELIKKPWIAQRKLYEVFVQSLNVIIDKVDGLSKTVKTEMKEEQISGQQEQEAVDQDPVDEVQENAELQHSKLQTFDEFLEENYEMTSEQFEHVGTYERRTIEDEYKEMVNAITGKDPWEVARESEDHAVSFDDKVSSVSMDEPRKEYEAAEGKRMMDALMEHYGNVSEREGLLRTRISLVTAVTEQHEHIYGPVYNQFNITEKISNCIDNMRLGNADGTFEMAIRETLQRYTTRQHKIDRLNDMAYLDENIRQVMNQQGETSKEIEQAARTGDYKAVKQKTDLFLEQGEKIIELSEDKFQKQIYDLQQMKWDNMLNADVWIKQPQPHKCKLEDGTKVFMDYRLNDVAAKSLRAGHENDIISDGYPNGYYLGTMNGYPQLIIHTQDKIIVSRSMTDDYSEGKSLADISNDLYQEYWNDMNRVEMKDMSMDNQIATELVTALAKVDAAYEVEQVDSLKEIEQRSGQSYRELYYEKRDECRLDKALVPKVGIASELEDGTYSLREVRIIDERLADIIKNNTEQVDTGILSADVKPGDFLLLKDNIMEPYQTFMVTEDGLMQAGDSRKAEVCNRYCTDQMLSSSFDVDMEQKCVKPLVEHGVTLQPGIQTRFEKNAKMFEMKNPVVPEQRKIQQNKIEMSM